MSGEITISDEGSAARMQKTMADMVFKLGKGLKETVFVGAWYVARAAGAATKVAPKLRPIVRNPNKRSKTDKRFAPFGVYMYKDGEKIFKPIYRTGEFGRIRFIDKKTFEVKYINTLTGKVHSAETFDQTPDVSIATDKRRIIGRRGLAKSVWGWMLKGLGKAQGKTYLAEMPGAFEVEKKLSGINPEIRLMSRLRYAGKAFKQGGKATAGNILKRASDAMRKSIEYKMRHLKA